MIFLNLYFGPKSPPKASLGVKIGGPPKELLAVVLCLVETTFGRFWKVLEGLGKFHK